MRKPRLILVFTLALALWPLGRAIAAEPLRVVASFSILADLVRQVGGEHVAVTSLVPIGQEPHEWEPEPRDAAALADADLVVVNGLGLEGWLDRLVAASGYKGPVLVASRDVKPILDAAGNPDPHAWQSIRQVKLYLRAIAAGLSRAAPQDAADFAARRDSYADTLSLIGEAVDIAVSKVPPGRRVAFTTHDAFAYLARDHGIEVLTPTGSVGSAYPLPSRLAELVARLDDTGAKAVFPEAGGDPRLAEVLASEAGVTVGGALYAGTLSPPGGPAADYLHMWTHNVFLMLRAISP